jgi:hypothetical protein
MKLPSPIGITATVRTSGRRQCPLRIGLVIVLGVATWTTRAEEVVAKPAVSTPTSAPVVVTETSVMATQAAINRRLSREKEAIAQERLKPTTPEKLIEKHGFIGSIFAKPSRVNPLQLINPKAPKEYGGVGEPAGAWSWNSMLAPGQAPLPRGFEDPVRHEASAVLIGVGFR